MVVQPPEISQSVERTGESLEVYALACTRIAAIDEGLTLDNLPRDGLQAFFKRMGCTGGYDLVDIRYKAA